MRNWNCSGRRKRSDQDSGIGVAGRGGSRTGLERAPDHVTPVAGTRGQRGPSLDGDATRAGDARPSRREAGGSFLPPTHTRAHARGIINICYCTYIRAGRPVSPPPPATGRTLNTLSPCLHMVRAWNRAVESECGAIDPEQWDRAVFVPRALRKRPSSFFHPKDKILPPLRSSSYSPSAFQFSILIDIELNGFDSPTRPKQLLFSAQSFLFPSPISRKEKSRIVVGGNWKNRKQRISLSNDSIRMEERLIGWLKKERFARALR